MNESVEQSSPGGEGELYSRFMTVAQLREPDQTGTVRVVFLESARFYRLERQNPLFEQTLERLHDALEQPRLLEVQLPAVDSDIILGVKEIPG
jgi:hypothetical protein